MLSAAPRPADPRGKGVLQSASVGGYSSRPLTSPRTGRPARSTHAQSFWAAPPSSLPRRLVMSSKCERPLSRGELRCPPAPPLSTSIPRGFPSGAVCGGHATPPFHTALAGGQIPGVASLWLSDIAPQTSALAAFQT